MGKSWLTRLITGLLESFTDKVRGLTVDKARKLITWLALGFVALTLVAIGGFFVLVGIFRIVGELVNKACDCRLHQEIGYAIVGGLFALLGWFLWSRRTPKESK